MNVDEIDAGNGIPERIGEKPEEEGGRGWWW